MGNVCGQGCEEEQKGEQRKDEVITERGRVVGHPVVLVLLVEALEKPSSVQLHTPRQFRIPPVYLEHTANARARRNGG